MMSQTSPPLECLLEQARLGDGEALGRLLELYRNYLRLLARSLVGRGLCVRLDYSDLVQETFLNAHRGFTSFRGHSEGELIAWLRRILARRLANHVKRDQGPRHNAGREESLEALLDHSDQALQQALIAPGSSPSAQTERRERAVLLADALEKLTPDQREVFTRRHVEQIPIREIAERMGKTSRAVEMLWLRAVEKLNAILGEQS
jgi:RNA polymerase sigma-70 factor (ECF subfamily)